MNNQNNNGSGYTLQDLTAMIRKCCSHPENAESRSQFNIDFVKLENMLKQKQTNLHTIAYSRTLDSEPVTIKHAQFISEYIKNHGVFEAALSSDSQIISFMMFSTVDETGEIRPKYLDDEGNPVDVPDKDLFMFCNEPEELNEPMIKSIINQHPVYRVIVVRMYSHRNDRFDYNVNIRSNYQMIQYQRSLREGNDGADTETTTEEVSEE